MTWPGSRSSRRLLAAIGWLLLLGQPEAELSASRGADDGPVTAFVDVTVVPMTSEIRLPRQTVVTHGDRIESIEPAATATVPADAIVVQGAGRYLMPGLADLHVHLGTAEEFILYIANGVTTVRNLNGGQVHLRWRWEIEERQELGPRIFTTGPILDGDPPVFYGNTVLRTVEEARLEVRRQKRAGYDAVKVYSLLPPEIYDAVVSESRAVGVPVIGHVPWKVGLEKTLAAGQRSLEHLYGYADAAEADDSPLAGRWDYRRLYGAVSIDRDRLTELARATREAGVWNCPTLVAIDHMVPPDEGRELLRQPHMSYVPPRLHAIWNPRTNFLNRYLDGSTPELRAQGRTTRREIVRALHRAGARLLLGTDSGSPYTAPGFSIHRELANLVEVGLTPYEALRTGTSAAAEFLGATHFGNFRGATHFGSARTSAAAEFLSAQFLGATHFGGTADRLGTVEVGKAADLILLEADPLEDVAHLRRRAGVMVRGYWIPEAQLRQFLIDQAARFEVAAAPLPAADELQEPLRRPTDGGP